MMLQQTQVNQVIPYYERFLRSFPDVKTLAAASLGSVLKQWEGLGYYARARNLHKAAQVIVTEYNGELPREPQKTGKLPGFGPYTSNAVLSIAFNEPVSVVDGNVTRIICRIYGIHLDTKKLATKKIIGKKADQLLDREHCAVFNEAFMELGATICTPRAPLCVKCPVAEYCQGRIQQRINELPYKSRSPAKPSTSVTTYIAFFQNKFLLVQRPVNGLLGGLWEFPCILTEPDNDFIRKFPTDVPFTGKIIKELLPVHHSFTHFNLLLKPVLIRVPNDNIRITFYSDARWLEFNKILGLPMHRSMHKVLQQMREGLEVIT